MPAFSRPMRPRGIRVSIQRNGRRGLRRGQSRGLNPGCRPSPPKRRVPVAGPAFSPHFSKRPRAIQARAAQVRGTLPRSWRAVIPATDELGDQAPCVAPATFSMSVSPGACWGIQLTNFLKPSLSRKKVVRE